MMLWLIALSALALGLALIALVAVIMTSRRQAELIERQQQRLLMLTETATEVLSLKEQLNEPKPDSNFAEKQLLAQLEQQVSTLNDEQRRLQEKLQELAEQDPGSKLYHRASKLVASGATVEELMHECELPQAEAELLVSLHQRKG